MHGTRQKGEVTFGGTSGVLKDMKHKFGIRCDNAFFGK